MSALRLALAVLAILWGVQFLLFREGWRSFLVRTGTKGELAERLWRVSPFIFAGLSFWWAAMILTTGMWGTVN